MMSSTPAMLSSEHDGLWAHRTPLSSEDTCGKSASVEMRDFPICNPGLSFLVYEKQFHDFTATNKLDTLVSKCLEGMPLENQGMYSEEVASGADSSILSLRILPAPSHELLVLRSELGECKRRLTEFQLEKTRLEGKPSGLPKGVRREGIHNLTSKISVQKDTIRAKLKKHSMLEAAGGLNLFRARCACIRVGLYRAFKHDKVLIGDMNLVRR